jgi:hypothetical protein
MEDEGVFNWLYGYAQSRGPGAPIYLTCTGKTDGAGAQAQAVASTQAFADAAGIIYAHTPFQNVEHASGDAPSWAARWEAFLNFGYGEVAAAALGLKPIRLQTLASEPEAWNDRPLLVWVPHSHAFADRNAGCYRRIVPWLQDKYYGADKSSLPQHKGPGIAVAIHIRRGDVTAQHAARFTPNDHILRVIDQICTVVIKKNLRSEIHVYSEGIIESFRDFEQMGCVLHLDEDVFATFHNLLEADILVMAKSSFSYAAALLSAGVKVYEPFWHQPLEDWLCLGPQATLCEAEFSALLDGALENCRLRNAASRYSTGTR